LPGGYVYITRGLMALANSEAELAGVVGHEIGHVTARHGAQQHGRSVLVGLGAGILGAVIGDRGVAQMLNTGGGLILRGYSREQEFEADSLGLRYMTQAGYDPAGMASFLEHLHAKSKLDSALLGSGTDPDERSLLSTHPRTIDRVQEARTAALGTGALGGRTEHAAYLRGLDGMIYDDSPNQGLVRGQRFVHPKLRFEFTVPNDFMLLNGPTAVRARGPNGAVIVFDMAPKPTGGTMLQYVRQQWGARLPLADLTALNVNGMETATGIARISASQGPFDLRLVAIRGRDNRIYRLLFGTPANDTARLNTALQRTTFSFREISEAEAAKEKPYRLHIYEARPGDTVARLAQWMPEGPQAEARFRVLNGLALGEEPAPGQLLKHVSY
jgi:predicted Zn-dependent protease